MTKLRVLHIEDAEDDALMVALELKRGGWDATCTRVETAPDMRAALETEPWDLVISDFGLPRFDAPSALSVLQEFGVDVPFIIVSGTIGEDAAVAAMKAGANDYVLKSNLKRLVPAIRRELREAGSRRERRRALAALLASLDRAAGTVAQHLDDTPALAVVRQALIEARTAAKRVADLLVPLHLP